MEDKDKLIMGAFKTLEKNSFPTESQKEIMLNKIMLECENESPTYMEKLKTLISTYPWRIAFLVSALQTIVLTVIFGTRYTNLFVGFFGG